MSNDEFDPKGVIPACLMPFDARLEIDEAAYRRHLSDLAGVEGITANEEVCRNFVETSIGVVTALNPLLGYEKSTEIAATALRTGKGVIELVREQGLLSEEQISEHLDPAKMVAGGKR